MKDRPEPARPASPLASNHLVNVPLHAIVISEHNTRKNLDAGTEDVDLDALAESIREQGLLQPPIVRRSGATFEVIAGQRRVLACRKLGLETVTVVVTEVSDDEAIAISIIENVHRADMHPLDKARAFRTLEDRHGSITDAARITGVSVATVRRYRNLLSLPVALQAKLRTGEGPTGVGFLSKLAEIFPDAGEALEVFAKVQGFKGGRATEIVTRSRGDLSAIDGLVDLAIAGEFDRVRCGTSLDTCPFVPPAMRGAIQNLVTGHRRAG